MTMIEKEMLDVLYGDDEEKKQQVIRVVMGVKREGDNSGEGEPEKH